MAHGLHDDRSHRANVPFSYSDASILLYQQHLFPHLSYLGAQLLLILLMNEATRSQIDCTLHHQEQRTAGFVVSGGHVQHWLKVRRRVRSSIAPDREASLNLPLPGRHAVSIFPFVLERTQCAAHAPYWYRLPQPRALQELVRPFPKHPTQRELSNQETGN